MLCFWIKSSLYIMAPGFGCKTFSCPGVSIPVHAICAISLGHADAFTFCTKSPFMSRRLNIFMSAGHLLIPVHAMHTMFQGHTNTLPFCIKIPICHDAWIETANNFMSAGHVSVPIHAIRAIFLGHTDTFTFCIKAPCMAWRLD